MARSGPQTPRTSAGWPSTWQPVAARLLATQLAATWLLDAVPLAAQSPGKPPPTAVTSQATAVAAAGAAAASTSDNGSIPIRMFVDLQDEHSRAALEQVFSVLDEASDTSAFAVLLHHVPLSRHAAARAAAAAAYAARQQGKEEAFVRALLQRASLHTDDLQAAAKAAGLDPTRLDQDRATSATLDEIERERRAAIAFGVRATPTALIGGRGVVGVAPRGVLRQAMVDARGAWARCLGRGVRDCERDVVRRRAPASLVALAMLRGRGLGRLGADKGRDRGVRGSLGDRWRVELRGDEPAIGAAKPEAIAVYFVDVTDPAAPADLQALLDLAAHRPWLRLVILPLGETEPGRGGTSAAAVDTSVALWSELRGKSAAEQLALWTRLSSQPAPVDSGGLARIVGWTEATRSARVGDTAATVLAERNVRLAVTVDGRPGALYIQGRAWQGTARDEGLAGALDDAKAEMARQPRKGIAGYAHLVASGRARDEAEIDLDGDEDLGELSCAVDLGTAGPPGVAVVDAWLFVDFAQPGSRAAFHALRLLREHPVHPVHLHLASIASSAEPGVTPASAALHVCARRGKALDCALSLFSVNDPNDWRQLRRALRRFGIKPQQLGEGAALPQVKDAMASAAAAAGRLDMVDDPVLYIGKRRYLGPVDENRITRAVAAEAKRAANSTHRR